VIANQLLQFVRTGTAPTDLTISGVLEPEASREFMSLVIDQAGYLSKCYRKPTRKLKSPWDVISLGNRKLIRSTEGERPEESVYNKHSNVGKYFENLKAELFYKLLQSTIEDNQDNPGFDQQLAKDIAVAFGNDLLDLAINGTSEDQETTSTFLEVNKGWIQKAKDSSSTNKVDMTSDEDIIASMDKALAAVDSKYKIKGISGFLMSTADVEKYEKLVEGKDTNAKVVIDGVPRYSYLGYPIEPCNYMPDSTILFVGKLYNGDLGMSYTITNIQKTIINDREANCIRYIYRIYCDFQIGRDPAISIGYEF